MNKSKRGKRATAQRKRKIEDNQDDGAKSLESENNKLEKDSTASKSSSKESCEENIESNNAAQNGTKDPSELPSHSQTLCIRLLRSFRRGPRTPPASPPRTRRLRISRDPPSHTRGSCPSPDSLPSPPLFWRGPRTPSNSPPMVRRGPRTPPSSPPVARRAG